MIVTPIRCMRFVPLLAVVSLLLVASGCYTYSWTAPEEGRSLRNAPAEVLSHFDDLPANTIHLEMVDPRLTYDYDPGERDAFREADGEGLHFGEAAMTLQRQMKRGQVVVDFAFTDELGNIIRIPGGDLMRLLPRIDSNGNTQYAEYLLEEYERTGVSFRLEHGEFFVEAASGNPADVTEALSRVYRVGIFNNCLDPGKWEFIVTAEDYGDFGSRLRGETYINQNRILAHSWFYMHPELYQSMLALKNPHLTFDPRIALDYMALAEQAKVSDINFDDFRTLGREHRLKVVELAHESGREISEPISEQYYKFGLDLFINRDEFRTYADLSKTPVRLAQFMDRGFYNPDAPKVFNFWFAEHLDDVRIRSIDQPDSDCYVEIEIDGEHVPFKLTFGNLDLALLNEQSFASLRFGVNPPPLNRRHSPVMNTLRYDTDAMPDRIKPYMFFTNKETGKFENNIDLGVEMVYVGWEDLDNNVLEIHLLSYERITPVWMGRVKLPDYMVDRVRVRRNLYAY